MKLHQNQNLIQTRTQVEFKCFQLHTKSFANQNVKVCLSGDGGDELFGGYWRLQSVLYSNIYRKILPYYLRKNIIPKTSNVLGKFGKRLYYESHCSIVIPTVLRTWIPRTPVGICAKVPYSALQLVATPKNDTI